MKINKHGALVPEKTTNSFLQFDNENALTEHLMFYILIGGMYIAEDKELGKSILIDIHEDPDNEISKKLVEKLKTETTDKLLESSFYERHFSQMAFSRSIDNLITYFKDILAEVVIKEPRILKSKEHERLDFILDYHRMEDLIKAISEKKIEELFYKGINDIESFFEDRLKIQIFKDDDAKKTINKLIKQRNIIVHNRGKISKEFAKEFPEFSSYLGQYITFSYKDISRINLYLNNYLVELDLMIASKYKLDLLNNDVLS